jgi:hypothetical protein
MMGAVSLVTFMAGAAGVGLLVVAGAFVWAKSLVEWKRQTASNKKRKFIVKSST